MNVISIIGRMTKDPELNYSQAGKAYSKFSVAVTRRMDKEKTDFFNCVAFGKTAEVIAEHFLKGNMIGMTGSMQMERYTDKAGNDRTSYSLIVDNFDFVEKKKSSPDAPAVEQFDDIEIYTGDIPF